MIFSISKKMMLGVTAGALLLTACGKQTKESGEVTIPDAPDAAIQTVITEFSNGNGGILWKAMPASYQNDVTELLQLAGTKVDPEIYDQSFSLVGRLGEVVNKQQAFILNTPMMADRSVEELAQIEAALPSIVGMINAISSSELATAEGLSHFNGQAFCDTTVSQFAQYAETLGKLSGEDSMQSDYKNTVVTVLEQEGQNAVLVMTVPEEDPEEVEFTKVGDRWVPAEIASDWDEQIAEARIELNAMSPEDIAAQKPQIMGVLTMLDGVLTQIAAAQTQEQFDQSLQGAMMPIMGLMMMGQGMGAQPMPSGGPDTSSPME
jgi:hypothetical protein